MSQAGSPGDGVSLELRATDQGAGQVLDATAQRLEQVAHAGNSAAQSQENFAKQAQKGVSSVLGPVGAASALGASLLRVVEATRQYLNSADEVGEANKRITDSIVGSGGTSQGLTQYEQELNRISKAAENASAQIDKMARDKSIGDMVAEFFVGEGVTEQAQREVAASAERQARGKAEADEKNRQSKAAADLLIELQKKVDAARAVGESAYLAALRQEDQANYEMRLRIIHMDGVTFDERTKLIDLENERHRRAVEGIQEEERRTLERLRKEEEEARRNAEADKKRREDAAKADEARFNRGAFHGLWAGAPDFFSASGDAELSMDILLRIPRN